MADAAELKTAAGRVAADEVREGMRVGLGTGTTAEAFVRVLAERVGQGLSVLAVATSERTEKFCRALNVPVVPLDESPELDLTVDGADEIGPGLALVKGGGGALLREKIVAKASKRLIVIADESKVVETLGAFPLPIEVNGFGVFATYLQIQKAVQALGLSGSIAVRKAGEGPFITDGGHLLLDASFRRIPDPEALSRALLDVPGVVQHGLFLGLASEAIVAGPSGVRRLTA